MIRYSLKCEKDHISESWFQSSDAFETLRSSGHLSCPTCGSTKVEKALMAPKVTPARKAAQAPEPAAKANLPSPKTTASAEAVAKAIETIRDHVESTSDYVGLQFAGEARAMHLGEKPHRPIYGQAKPEEAKALLEDGIPVAPLPFIPKKQTN